MAHKWWLTSAFSLMFFVMLWRWFGVKLYKLGATILAVALSYFIFKSNHLWFLFPFSAGIAGVAISLGTTEGESSEAKEWLSSTWGYAKADNAASFGGVLVAGFLLGRPESEGIIPNAWVSSLLGGNSLLANFFASFAGAFMYFATLTEVPIVQGLLGSGMGKGPALALLLSGPALSLPNMLVIKSVLGWKKTIYFISLVIVLSTLAGAIFGLF
jgi:uncharacterized membrane protein YraQ (UPF0718 family)